MQLDESLADFARLSGDQKEIDLVYIAATAVLWPIRLPIKEFEGEAIDAVREIAGSDAKHVIKTMQTWEDRPLAATRKLSEEAQTNPKLNSALTALNDYFEAVPIFAGHVAQLLGQAQEQGDVYHVSEQIKAAIVSFGGRISIQSLEINFNVVMPAPTSREKQLMGSVAFLASVVALVVLTIGWLMWDRFVPKEIPPMGSGFNIAVAEFVVLDDTVPPATGAEFSDWLFNAIEREMEQLPPALSVNTRGPGDTGIVKGEDPETRNRRACALADKHNATILIYGTVTEVDNDLQIQLEFCVPHGSFDYGSEVAGPEQLGQPIPVDMQLSPEDRFNLNGVLNARTQALRHIVTGLANFYIRRFEEAADHFQDAADIEDWHQGREVAFLLLGAARLRGYDQITNPEPLAEAEAAFRQAYKMNENYARSYLGLGAVARAQAAVLNETRTGIVAVDADKLREAGDWYTDSLEAAEQPALAYIPVKAAHGLGQVHLLGFEHNVPGWSGQEAERLFDEVIAAYEAEPVPELAWFAAHAHALSGRLAGHRRKWDTMSAENRRAIDMLENLPGTRPYKWIARYWSWVGMAEEQAGHMDEAREAYTQAIKVGTGHAGAQEVEKWRRDLERVG